MPWSNRWSEIHPTIHGYAAYYRGVYLGEYADEADALRCLVKFMNYITWRERSWK